jgi:ribosomal protein L22
MYVKEAFVNCGPSMKRILPAPMGRAYRMVKRSNHVTIVIAEKAQKAKKAAAPKAKESTKEAKPVKESAKESKPVKETKEN